MKSTLINLLGQARSQLFSTDRHSLGQILQVAQDQLAGKIIVDKQHLRTLLLAVAASDLNAINELRNGRWLAPQTNPIDVLLRQLNEEG